MVLDQHLLYHIFFGDQHGGLAIAENLRQK
jgi:hypothetical protein